MGVSEALEESSRFFRSVRGQAAGRSVFIFGTGPSARDIDLSLARNEITITVNSFGLHPLIDELSPTYHLLADPGFWDGSLPELKAFHQHSLDFVSRSGTRIMMPSWGLDGPVSPEYYKWKPLYYRYGAHATSFDFSGEIPQLAQNVMNVALMFCFHLRARDVFLVGFDNGGFITDFSQHDHFHPEATDELCGGALTIDLVECLYSHLREQAKIFREATRVGMSISTCSPSGTFRRYPYVEYESLFSRHRGDNRPASSRGGRAC